jgi:hypothetical protein
MRAGYIKIQAKLKGKLKDIYDSLSKIGEKVMIVKAKDGVSLAYIESKDIKGSPQEFFIIDFRENSIDIGYTISDKIEAVRKWDVINKTFPILNLTIPYYDIDMGFMMDLVGNLVKELESIIPAGSGEVMVERDKLKSKVNELTALVSNYKHENEELTKKLYSIGNKFSSTEAKLEKFMKFSDEVLQLKVSDWIRDHDGEFDLKTFCERYEVGEQRVMNIVQDMISGGFIKQI